MTINGHLLLLVLATGVFVRLWNANSQPQFSPVTRATREMIVASPPEPEPVVAATAVVQHPVSVSVTTATPAEENWTLANCPIPLPAGISVGTYRVVDDTGRVARLEVAAADVVNADTNPREVPADFNIVSIDARRWYFIRLQSPVAVEFREGTENVIGDAVIEAESNAGPFENRKFDFSGYEMSNLSDDSEVGESVVGEPANEEITRPDSPDLPISR